MVKEQWWSLLKVLISKYESGATPAISAVLSISLPKGSVLGEAIVQMVHALNEKSGKAQEKAIQAALSTLSADRHFLPQVIPLLAARFDSILSPLVQLQRMGVNGEALSSLARKNINESSDPLLKEAFSGLQRVGKQLTQFTKTNPKDKTDATSDLLQGPRSPIVERLLQERQLEQHKKHKTPEKNKENAKEADGYSQPGDIIGAQDWKLIELLGRGGMGSVWKARNHFEELGALKLMLPHLVSNDRLIRRFQLEIRAIKKIRHSNVVELSDWGRDRVNGRDRWYFVTDFIEGKALSKILQERGALSLEETKEIFLQVADGLEAAHQEGVVHRDIKPGNIMIRPDGSPVIIDFGIARQLEDPSMTQTHERVLTLQFASPEQLYGEPVSPKSDVFSLAATMSFVLHPDPKRQRPQFEPEKVPEAFHWILEKSLSYKPEHRPQNMKDFAELLSQIKFSNGVLVNFPLKPTSITQDPFQANIGLSPQNALKPGSNQRKKEEKTFNPSQEAKSVSAKQQASKVSPSSSAQNLSHEIYHYHGPKGQQKLPLAEIVELVKATPRGRHLVWKKGWSEWKPWYKVKHLKEYVQTLKESQTQQSLTVQSLTPFSKHVIKVMGAEHTLISIPSGSFWMGNQNVDAESDEKPRHRVHLTKGFLLGQTQLTQDFFEAVCGHNPSQYKHPNHPIERISWFDVIRWCNTLSEQQNLRPAYQITETQEGPKVLWSQMNDGYRIPTEAEWEYAARSGTNFTYSGSNRPDEVAWFGASRRREGQKTYAVAQKKSNGWGLYDMSGNVWEWCWEDMRTYTMKDTTDPIGESNTGHVICRGGSNYLDARQTRCSYRMRYATNNRSLFVGFRIARTLK